MNLRYLDIFPLIQKYQVQPKKSLGQNFLVDPNGLNKVLQAAQLNPEDTVLEIGAGLGSLTYLLAQQAKQVVAVELDKRLIPPLTEALAGFDNVTIKQGDMLALSPDALLGAERYVVVANIPYYITSALIRHLLEAEHKPTRMVLTMQQEVAERILAWDGKMSLLALSVQVYGKPELKARIPAGCFYPAPEVDSAVLTIELYPQPLIAAEHLDLFFELAHAGFAQKRKTLRNTLASGMKKSPAWAEQLLGAAGIDPQRRAETLSLPEWKQIVEAYQALI
ncbi:MAG TPA: 16S rRNA (adenine(1518)-N(6)/adenine(1519)-N(6))-dimethyltransferase RsmA [Anaerolineaceae bacterium]|nr:ribosomal RNA small subunit methyltransferase A [Anaerolineaceae bacterium]HOV30138.1 16S rRNA (adenine(1518)-N(6)/adenine(1519)-N(6))-dimethyltransferase RsmA [Anaerolineaceae bacterium]HUM48996.1 16S rRNA (adenine(1518)-N(6)/adenine(1519)-N(6))-dimethyltransferase RsmA [Anaerolineaceae bacterium]